jgi:hypothetical protein
MILTRTIVLQSVSICAVDGFGARGCVVVENYVLSIVSTRQFLQAVYVLNHLRVILNLKTRSSVDWPRKEMFPSGNFEKHSSKRGIGNGRVLMRVHLERGYQQVEILSLVYLELVSLFENLILTK